MVRRSFGLEMHREFCRVAIGTGDRGTRIAALDRSPGLAARTTRARRMLGFLKAHRLTGQALATVWALDAGRPVPERRCHSLRGTASTTVSRRPKSGST